MGTHISCIAQRRVNGKWRHMLDVPCSPIRLDWFTYVHYSFMTYCGHVGTDSEEADFALSLNRGFPEDYDGEQGYAVDFCDPNDRWFEVESVSLPTICEFDKSWLTLDELVEHDYDRIVTRIGETKPLREFLGEKFIQFWRDVKAQGAERIVFAFS